MVCPSFIINRPNLCNKYLPDWNINKHSCFNRLSSSHVAAKEENNGLRVSCTRVLYPFDLITLRVMEHGIRGNGNGTESLSESTLFLWSKGSDIFVILYVFC